MKKTVTQILSLLWFLQAGANPTGPVVMHGAAAIDGLGTAQMEVTVGHSAIINWDSFSVHQHESTRFNQPDSQAAVLNRVTGLESSWLDGRLSANGQLYLINPNGVLIGPNGRIDVGAFIASTLDCSNEEWLLGGNTLFSGDSQAQLVNQGVIHAASGDVILIGNQILNSGAIRANNGVVGLGVGQKVWIQPGTSERIFIQPTISGAGQGEQMGVIEALQVEMKSHGNAYALAVHPMSQTVAKGVVEREGRIYLVANEGMNEIRGELVAPQGEIRALGETVLVGAESRLDVSALGGGGTLLVGSDSKSLNSRNTIVEDGSQLLAHADQSGNGGTIFIWSDEMTDFAGHASVKGGQVSGNGGMVEVSGLKGLSYQGTVDLSAPNGHVGHLLLDPKNAIIQALGVDPPTGQTFASNPAGTVTIDGAALATALGTGNVTIQCNNDCTIDDDVSVASGTNALTLQTGRSIIVNAGRTVSLGGDFNATINDIAAIALQRDPGAAQFSMAAGSTIKTTDGSITIIPSNLTGATEGSLDIAGAIQTQAGSIVLDGAAPMTGGVGVTLSSGGSLTTTAGNIAVWAGGGSGANNNYGMSVDGATITTDTGFIKLSGLTIDPTGNNNHGLSITGSSVISSTSGNITLAGQGSSGVDNNDGIYCNNAKVLTDGTVLITGAAGPSTQGIENNGVELTNGTVVQTGAGMIMMLGSGGAGNVGNDGVQIAGGSLVKSTGGGLINIEGVSPFNGNTSCVGVVVDNGTIQTSGGVQIEGLGSPQGTDCNGIVINGASALVEGLLSGPVTLLGQTVPTNPVGNNVGCKIQNGGIVRTQSGNISVTGLSAGSNLASLQGIAMTNGALVTSQSGRIDFLGTGGSGVSSCNGIVIISSSVTTQSGPINLVAKQGTPTATGNAAFIGSGFLATSQTGTIDIAGTANAGGGFGVGIALQNNSAVSTAADITLTGIGAIGSGIGNSGVTIASSTIQGSVTGNVTITGTAGSGAGGNHIGISITGAPALISTALGTINLQGRGGSGGNSDYGILMQTNSRVLSTSGAINCLGTAIASTGSFQRGIYLNSGCLVQTAGSIQMVGTGGGLVSTNHGCELLNSTVETLLTGGLTMRGMSGQGTNSQGIRVTGALGAIRTLAGSMSLVGQSNGSLGGSDSGVSVEAGATVSSSSGAITVNGQAGTGTGSGANRGVNLLTGGQIQTGGSLSVTGVGGGGPSTSDGVSVLSGSTITTSGSLPAVINGTSTALGTDFNRGVIVSGIGSKISATGSGTLQIIGKSLGSGTDDRGVLINSSAIVSTNTGGLTVSSTRRDLEMASSVSTTQAQATFLSVQGSDSILCTLGGNINIQGACIAAANRDISVAAGVTFSVADDLTFVVDQQNPFGLGNGFFINQGAILNANNNLAIYAVSGPQAPPGIDPPNQIVFGNLVGLPTWDAGKPAGLAHKYNTSYSGGGPFHGPGFGFSYVPGDGVFGSQVVWYKYPVLISGVIEGLLRPFQINTDVSSRYFLFPPWGCRNRCCSIYRTCNLMGPFNATKGC